MVDVAAGVKPIVGELPSSRSGTTLFTVKYHAASPKAVIVFVHGFTDHAQRHISALFPLLSQGFSIMAYDQAGHGHSGPPGIRSYVWDFNNLVDDLIAFVEKVVRPQHPDLPVFAVGHSMGCCVSMLAACRRPELFKGLVLMAPLVRTLPPGTKSYIMATVASVLNWLPGMSYMRAVKRRPIELGMRDTTGIEQMRKDPYWDPQPYFLGSVVAMVQATRMLRAEAPRGLRNIPIFIIQGTVDAATPHEATRDFVWRLRSVRAAAAAAPASNRGWEAAAWRVRPSSVTSNRQAQQEQQGQQGHQGGHGEKGGQGQHGEQEKQAEQERQDTVQAPAEEDGSGVRYLEVEGAYHDLFHDPATPECVRKMHQWLASHVAK